MSLVIHLQQATDETNTPTAAQLQTWLETAIKQLPSPPKPEQNEITIRIIGIEESSQLNQQFRQKEGPTNVLSFPDIALAGIDSESLGDLAICAELVTQEAQEQQKSVESHWAHLVIHGLLHLIGYDHQVASEAKTMESLEIAILAKLTYPNPYE